jgi:hypothetical protein
MLDNMVMGLGGRLGELLKESQLMQMDYKQSVKVKMARQVVLVDPKVSNEAALEMVTENPDVRGRLCLIFGDRPSARCSKTNWSRGPRLKCKTRFQTYKRFAGPN